MTINYILIVAKDYTVIQKEEALTKNKKKQSTTNVNKHDQTYTPSIVEGGETQHQPMWILA